MPSFITRTYSYYPDGRLKSISGYSDDVRNFVYDYKGRLTSINGTTTFAYDHFGNRISKTVNGVTTNYKYDVGGRLVSAGNVNYSYNADGIRCKKTAIGSAKGERMYLDGGKILGEDRANCKLRYFYDATGLKRIRTIENKNDIRNYECVKDSQGSIIMLINADSGKICCRYEYDALGKCAIVYDVDNVGNVNPFKWKGFFFDTESGFYYANGSYYDPETGMYVDAAPVSTVIDNADSPRHIDRNGTLCYNHLAIAGSPYTVFPVTDMQADPNYTPGQTWWDKLWGTIGSWWRSIPKWQKVLVGAIFIAVSIGIAVATCGASVGPEAQLLGGAAAATALATAAKVALIEVSIGIGFAVAGWAINAADTGDWSINALEEAVADSIFFTGLFMFISTSVSAIKYMYRADPYPAQEAYKLANRGHSQGGIEPSTLKHQLALEQAISNPTAGTKLPISIGDTRWAMQRGWNKMQQVFSFYNGEQITIHYVMNQRLMLIDDFKIVKILTKRL